MTSGDCKTVRIASDAFATRPLKSGFVAKKFRRFAEATVSSPGSGAGTGVALTFADAAGGVSGSTLYRPNE